MHGAGSRQWLGDWHIRGYGYFTIETKSGDIAGISGIWYPETWPEPEVGYVVLTTLKVKASPMKPPAAHADGPTKILASPH